VEAISRYDFREASPPTENEERREDGKEKKTDESKNVNCLYHGPVEFL